MGCSDSKYRIIVSEQDGQINIKSWIASPSTKLLPFKNENFSPLSPVGKGKFGLVYLTKHVNSSSHVAIKYIPMKIILDCDSQVRIQQEIDVLQKLDHPFFAHFFGGFETPGCIALVFEYCYGGEMYTRMKQFNNMPEMHAKFYFSEIALGLDYLHNKLNIVYRDLKPENILIDLYGHIKLCDFGFAVPLNSSNDEGLRDTVGTAMYVAPEIAGGKRGGTHSYEVDWWSLGCVLYEMIMGYAPFGDTDKMSKFEIFNNINNRNINLPLTMNNHLSNLIHGLLQKDPVKRSNWTQVKVSQWLLDIDWQALYDKKIIPPWIPTLSENPSTSNFVSWDSKEIEIPNTASPNALSYCKQISIPNCKFKSEDTSKGKPAMRRQTTGIISSNNDKTTSSSSSGNSNIPRRQSTTSVETRSDNNKNSNDVKGTNTTTTTTTTTGNSKSSSKMKSAAKAVIAVNRMNTSSKK